MSRRCLLVFLISVSLVSVRAEAQVDLPAVQFAGFGLVGLARLETARLNVVNAMLPDGVPAEPCHVFLRFLTEQGEPFARSVAEADLLPGQATLLDLPASTAFEGGGAARRLFRASVEVAAPPEVPPSPCVGVVATLEMFDNLTGRLVSFNQNPGPPGVEGNPGPPTVYGMLGLARLQAAVLTAINLSPQTRDDAPTPCSVGLTFLDAAGQMFLSGGRTGDPILQRADLLPGEFASLVLPPGAVFGDGRDLRRAFRASVSGNPGPPTVPPSPCAGLVHTLELVDLLTGRTQLMYSAQSNPGPPN